MDLLKKIEKFRDLQKREGIAPAIRAGISSLRTYLGYAHRNSVAVIQKGDGLKKSQHQGLSLPVPPDSLLWSIGSPDLANYLHIGEVWSEFLKSQVVNSATILDIGSGCARIARQFVGFPHLNKYVGFDVIAENVEWCQNFIIPAAGGKMSFHHMDIFSDEYNHRGKIKSTEVHFPLENQEADLVFAASVFTHLVEADAAHYLKETARVLKTKGRAVFSIHNSIKKDASFSGSESRIEIGENYFVKMAAQHGLSLFCEPKDFYGQYLLVFEKTP